MSAFFSVPAACIARSAATMTTIPPLSSPAPGPVAFSPSRTKCWKGESGSKTVSRWPIRSIFLPLPSPLWVATIWPARPVSVIGIHWTVKPSGSSSARIIRPTASTPARLSEPLFCSTRRSSKAMLRSFSCSTMRIIFCSCGLSRAEAAAGRNASMSASKSGNGFIGNSANRISDRL
jgi:hypothetical protein